MSSVPARRRAIRAGEPGEGTGVGGAAEVVVDARRATVGGGSNPSRVRAHNERLVLSPLRGESLSRARRAPRERLHGLGIALPFEPGLDRRRRPDPRRRTAAAVRPLPARPGGADPRGAPSERAAA